MPIPAPIAISMYLATTSAVPKLSIIKEAPKTPPAKIIIKMPQSISLPVKPGRQSNRAALFGQAIFGLIFLSK